MPKKPTAAQRKVLEAMRDGNRLYRCNDDWWTLISPHRCWVNVATRMPTMAAIDFAGWIAKEGDPEQVNISTRRQYYTLTESGLSALKQSTP